MPKPLLKTNGLASKTLNCSRSRIRKKWTSALHCLKCGRTLQAKIVGKAQLFACPEGHGAWLDEVTLDSIHKS